MRTVFLIGLCLGWRLCVAQTVLLPSWVADSLIYEAKLSRQCLNVVIAQQAELKTIASELLHTGKALDLSKSESKTLGLLVENAKESNQILTKQFSLDMQKEKRKAKRWRRIAILETVGVVVGLIILL